jgi:hypothetical protein
MSDKPISDLRRRMLADMTVRSFSDKTRHQGGRIPLSAPPARRRSADAYPLRRD